MRRRKRPEKITFFVDRSLGSQIVPNALRQAGATVEIHDDHFSADEEDLVWLQEWTQSGEREQKQELGTGS